MCCCGLHSGGQHGKVIYCSCRAQFRACSESRHFLHHSPPGCSARPCSIYLHLCRLEPIYWPLHLSAVFNAFLPLPLPLQAFTKCLPDNTSLSLCSRQVIWSHFAAACGADRSGLVSARTDYLQRLLIKLSNHPNFETVVTATCRKCDPILFVG